MGWVRGRRGLGILGTQGLSQEAQRKGPIGTAFELTGTVMGKGE